MAANQMQKRGGHAILLCGFAVMLFNVLPVSPSQAFGMAPTLGLQAKPFVGSQSLVKAAGSRTQMAVATHTNMDGTTMQRRGGRGIVLFGLVALMFLVLPASPAHAAATAVAAVGTASPDFVTRMVGAASQGAVAAAVAAILSAFTEPVVNRLLVERCTVQQAIAAIKLKDCLNFFMTTFPTNMIKFPIFEVINAAMAFTSLRGAYAGVVSGWLFCTIMLPVTNFRFRKSMNLPIEPKLLYQAYLPTVCRDIVYGWARTVAGAFVVGLLPHLTSSHTGRAANFGIVVFISCILSAPFNELRGYTLQPADRKLPFMQFFRPERFIRSTSVGATIMGISLFAGNMLVPVAETLFAMMKANKPATGIVLACLVGAKILTGRKSSAEPNKSEEGD